MSTTKGPGGYPGRPGEGTDAPDESGVDDHHGGLHHQGSPQGPDYARAAADPKRTIPVTEGYVPVAPEADPFGQPDVASRTVDPLGETYATAPPLDPFEVDGSGQPLPAEPTEPDEADFGDLFDGAFGDDLDLTSHPGTAGNARLTQRLDTDVIRQLNEERLRQDRMRQEVSRLVGAKSGEVKRLAEQFTEEVKRDLREVERTVSSSDEELPRKISNTILTGAISSFREFRRTQPRDIDKSVEMQAAGALAQIFAREFFQTINPTDEHIVSVLSSLLEYNTRPNLQADKSILATDSGFQALTRTPSASRKGGVKVQSEESAMNDSLETFHNVIGNLVKLCHPFSVETFFNPEAIQFTVKIERKIAKDKRQRQFAFADIELFKEMFDRFEGGDIAWEVFKELLYVYGYNMHDGGNSKITRPQRMRHILIICREIEAAKNFLEDLVKAFFPVAGGGLDEDVYNYLKAKLRQDYEEYNVARIHLIQHDYEGALETLMTESRGNLHTKSLADLNKKMIAPFDSLLEFAYHVNDLTGGSSEVIQEMLEELIGAATFELGIHKAPQEDEDKDPVAYGTGLLYGVYKRVVDTDKPPHKKLDAIFDLLDRLEAQDQGFRVALITSLVEKANINTPKVLIELNKRLGLTQEDGFNILSTGLGAPDVDITTVRARSSTVRPTPPPLPTSPPEPLAIFWQDGEWRDYDESAELAEGSEDALDVSAEGGPNADKPVWAGDEVVVAITDSDPEQVGFFQEGYRIDRSNGSLSDEAGAGEEDLEAPRSSGDPGKIRGYIGGAALLLVAAVAASIALPRHKKEEDSGQAPVVIKGPLGIIDAGVDASVDVGVAAVPDGSVAAADAQTLAVDAAPGAADARVDALPDVADLGRALDASSDAFPDAAPDGTLFADASLLGDASPDGQAVVTRDAAVDAGPDAAPLAPDASPDAAREATHTFIFRVMRNGPRSCVIDAAELPDGTVSKRTDNGVTQIITVDGKIVLPDAEQNFFDRQKSDCFPKEVKVELD